MVKIRPFAFTSSSWPIAWPKPWFMPWSCAEAAPNQNRSEPERFRSPGYKQFGLSEVVTAEQFFGLALICKGENVMRIVTMFLTLVLAASITPAQQNVPPPPQPVNDAPANAEVLLLLRAGMPESVVLDKIHAITDKFDSSPSALITLKQAGATETELKAV